MSEKRKHASWRSILSIRKQTAARNGKSISGKVDVRIDVRSWLLWAILALALIVLWIWIVLDQTARPLEIGEPVNGQSEQTWGEQTGEERPQDGRGTGPAASEDSSPFPVRINRAGVEELQQLPGIGPAKAQAIVQHRMLYGLFESKEQLQEVKGIGPKTLERLSDLIAVD